MAFELTLLLHGSTSRATVTSGVVGRWEPQRQQPGRLSKRGRDLPKGAIPLWAKPHLLSPPLLYPLIPYRLACLETDRLSLTSTSQTPSFKFQPNRSAAGQTSDDMRSDQIRWELYQPHT